MAYIERKTLNYWNDSQVVKIYDLIKEIGRIEGFLEAVFLEDTPRETCVEMAKNYAKDGLVLIDRYRSLPEGIRNIDETISKLEKFCQGFLSLDGRFSKKLNK